MKLRVYKIRAYIEVEAPDGLDDVLASMTDDWLRASLPSEDIITEDGDPVRFVGGMITEVETTSLVSNYMPPRDSAAQ